MARSALLRPFLGTLATNGVIVLVGMATGILAARLLGPEQRGALAVLLFWSAGNLRMTYGARVAIACADAGPSPC